MHPKNHMKLTGDIHPPELGDDWGRDDDAELFGNEAALRSEILHKAEGGGRPQTLKKAGHEIVLTQPLLVLGAALALGYIVTKLLRR